MLPNSSRRAALVGLGVAAAAIGAGGAQAASVLTVPGATALAELAKRIAAAPRRRDFKTVPMILNDPDQWDHAALNEVIAYRGGPKQVWDNTEIGGPWLNLMRNALNAQIWSFKHQDFLAVSATHGSAHLALFDQATWDKYEIARLTAGKLASNTLIVEQKAAAGDPTDYESDKGVFSGHDNSIVTLQRRGVVFLACHNAIWEIAEKLMAAGSNPDTLTHEAMAAELTNHLIPGVVLTPGAVGTLPELQQAGFHYAT
jgi:intracellular sulfur oxidation DsrE/DsrF family protein